MDKEKYYTDMFFEYIKKEDIDLKKINSDFVYKCLINDFLDTYYFDILGKDLDILKVKESILEKINKGE